MNIVVVVSGVFNSNVDDFDKRVKLFHSRMEGLKIGPARKTIGFMTDLFRS